MEMLKGLSTEIITGTWLKNVHLGNQCGQSSNNSRDTMSSVHRNK